MNSPVRRIHARTAFVWLALGTLPACSDASGTTDTVFPQGGSTPADGGSNNPGQGGVMSTGNGGSESSGTNSGAQNGGSFSGSGGSSSGGAGNGGAQGSGGNASNGAGGALTFGSGGNQSQGGTSFGRGGTGNGRGGNASGGRAAGGSSAGGRNNSSGGASGAPSGGKSAGGAPSGGAASGGNGNGGNGNGGNGSGGVNVGGASAGAGGDPFAVAAKCTSGANWTSGNNANMRPGEACVGCHRFTLAGTVYPTGHEPNDCNGVGTSAAATVVITDAKGTTLRLSVNSAGNFYSSSAISAPYTAVVQTSKGSRAMVAPQTNGNCNSCHTQNGANGAPGRIVVP